MPGFIGFSEREEQGITQNAAAVWLDRAVFILLIVTAAAAPHAISITQTAWITAMVVWTVRLSFKPRPKFLKTPLNGLLAAFFLWSVISAAFSYAPDISFDKLRSVSLLSVFFLVVNNLHEKRAAVLLVCVLVFSSMFNVLLTPVQKIVGRGVEISGMSLTGFLAKNVSPDDILHSRFAREGDTITEVNNRKIHSPEEITAEIESRETSVLTLYRPDYYFSLTVKRADLPDGNSAAERLGFQSWKKSRNWRSTGFFGHYTTYAEVLQLLASLVCGIFIALLRRKTSWKPRLVSGFILSAILLALLLTVTRASQAAFLVSVIMMISVAAGRRTILATAVLVLLAAAGGSVFLKESRNTDFYTQNDNSVTWRQTVYREGFNLLTESPRHLAVGVGMDSIKRFAKDWHLFDDGRLPSGHFHSTPLQIAVERGLPALFLWLAILFSCGRLFWSNLKFFKKENREKDLQSVLEEGIILGCFGGLIGFFTSGLVHYNLGDSEVAMLFYFLTGIAVFLCINKKMQSVEDKNQKVLPSL